MYVGTGSGIAVQHCLVCSVAECAERFSSPPTAPSPLHLIFSCSQRFSADLVSV